MTSTRKPESEGARPLPQYLLDMVRRPVPDGCGIVPGSTPVVSFGDPSTAEVASLGINPSGAEFLNSDGHLLNGGTRRLATLESLGAASLLELDDAAVHSLVSDCATYFCRNPYWKWFGRLDKLLRPATGTTYRDGTACHLDLIQWATSPVWGGITDPAVRRRLLADGVPHLHRQLDQENVRLVLLNGRTVLDQVQAAGVCNLDDAGLLTFGRNVQRTCRLYAGAGAGIQFLGWSANIVDGHGITNELVSELAEWVAQHAGGLSTNELPDTGMEATMTPPAELTANGHLPEGATVTSKQELTKLLGWWLESSTATTIGDTRTYPRRAWVHVELPGDVHVVLNSDTKRQAVKTFVDDARRRGEHRWWVIAGTKGTVNKVVFDEHRQPTPGWYAYTRRPLSSPQEI